MMKSKIIFLLLSFAALALQLFIQSCSNDDETPVIGTSYWSSKDLKGHWVAMNENSTCVFDFEENGTFTIDCGVVGSNRFGKYSTVNSVYPQEIGVKFPNESDDNLWTVWTIEWITPDKSEMQISTYRLKKEK